MKLWYDMKSAVCTLHGKNRITVYDLHESTFFGSFWTNFWSKNDSFLHFGLYFDRQQKADGKLAGRSVQAVAYRDNVIQR